MKQIRQMIIGAALLAGIGVFAFSLDISLEGSLGNMTFDTNRTSALSAGNLAFSENLYWTGTAKIEQAIADNAIFSIIANHDNILRNSLYTTCLLYTSPSPRDRTRSRMPSSA